MNVNLCDNCFAGCTACSGASTICSACAIGYYLHGTTCDTTCPDRFFLNTGGNTCDACNIFF